MKAVVESTEYEGFLASKSIVFDNGLKLITPNLLWCGKANKEECLRLLEEVIEAINKGQVEICGS